MLPDIDSHSSNSRQSETPSFDHDKLLPSRGQGQRVALSQPSVCDDGVLKKMKKLSLKTWSPRYDSQLEDPTRQKLLTQIQTPARALHYEQYLEQAVSQPVPHLTPGRRSYNEKPEEMLIKEFDTFCPPTPPKPSPVETPSFTREEPLKYQLTLADALNKQLMKEISEHPSKARS